MLPAFTFAAYTFMTNLTSLSKTGPVSATAHSPLSLLEKAAAVFSISRKYQNIFSDCWVWANCWGVACSVLFQIFLKEYVMKRKINQTTSNNTWHSQRSALFFFFLDLILEKVLNLFFAQIEMMFVKCKNDTVLISCHRHHLFSPLYGSCLLLPPSSLWFPLRQEIDEPEANGG